MAWLCMVSLTIVATLKAVGIILSISLLIAPGAIAVLVTTRFHVALLVAVMVSMLVCVSGVYLSFYLDSACADHRGAVCAAVYHHFCRNQRERYAAGKCDSRVITLLPSRSQ